MSQAIEKFHKYLHLEIDRNYDNRSIFGGLDKILPSWQDEARQENIPENFIQTIVNIVRNYTSQNQEERARTIATLLRTLREQQPDLPLADKPAKQPHKNRAANSTDAPPVRTRAERMAAVKENITPRWMSNLPPAIEPDTSLKKFPGITEANLTILNRLEINTAGDLLYYFPFRYDDYSQLKPINRLQYGEKLTIIATVQSCQTFPSQDKRRQITEAVVSDQTGFLRITWYNKPYITNYLTRGVQIVISGKVEMYLGRLVMNSPEWDPLEREHLHTYRIVPVYPLVSGISQKELRTLLFKKIGLLAPRIPEYLPQNIRQSAELVSLAEALQNIHFPGSERQLQQARNRLAFDEIFLLQLGLLRQKRNWQVTSAKMYTISDEWLTGHTNTLPYTLTGAQKRVLEEVRADLASGRPMNRLLQGDVGSGKTVVAALTIAMIAHAGDQSALMAPTSILAEQHYRNLYNLLTSTEPNDLKLKPEEIALLVGNTPEAERKLIHEKLEDGTIKILIGTHALLEEPVVFKNLHLAIIDEQHRFGVTQRATLRNKGTNPHLFVMTATPIPRTLALTIYSDLDISLMDEMPAGRQVIETFVFNPLERERAYHLVRKEVDQGHQAFIVYPLIQQADNDDAEGKAAVEEYHRLQKEVFPTLKLGLLHGQMKADEKEAVMSGFRDGEYHILVSTTVIEVGVDVANATIMLIESANRFGLAQLHQLRGRVGRGQAKSYCILIAEAQDKVENERLTVMAETNNGFILAEHDLRQRGPGEFLGVRQSGYSELKVATLTDLHLIEKARRFAQQLFETDPDFNSPEYQELNKKIDLFWSGGKGDVS